MFTKDVFNALVWRLGLAVADLGTNTAGDATELSARHKPVETAQNEIDEGLLQPSSGHKADSKAVHELFTDRGITLVIQMRSPWDGEPERLLPGHDGSLNIVYDKACNICYYDKLIDVSTRHKMAYIGYEPERETLKYRCPAKHEGWSCPMSEICNAGKLYGKTVWVPRETDLRRFPSLPRATKKFERLYKGRTAM